MMGTPTNTSLLPPVLDNCMGSHPYGKAWSDDYELFNRLVNGYLTVACVLLGTAGNAICVRYVHARMASRDQKDNHGTSLSVALTLLALWDTGLLWCAFGYYGLKNLAPGLFRADSVAIHITPTFHALSQIANTASIWSVVTVTVQRYLATRNTFTQFRFIKWLLYMASAEITAQNRLVFYRQSMKQKPPKGGGGQQTQAQATTTALLGAATTCSFTAAVLDGGGGGQGERNGAKASLAVPVPATAAAADLASRKPSSSLTIQQAMPWLDSPRGALAALGPFYRRYLRLPLGLSAIAIIVNLPAFFELIVVPCVMPPTRKAPDVLRLGNRLKVSPLRWDAQYKLWYKLIFRMLVTSCGPNILILVLTVLTVLILREAKRARKQLLKMSESELEKYSAKAKMLTTISVMLVVKFLLFRSLSFLLDVWEVTFGLRERVHIQKYMYLVDLSNFLILLNSATNCVIISRGSRWIQKQISLRHTLRKERRVFIRNLNTKRKIMLIDESWSQAKRLTLGQIGNQILHAMLAKSPQLLERLRHYVLFVAAAAVQPSQQSVDDEEGEGQGGGGGDEAAAEGVPLQQQGVPPAISGVFTNPPRPTTVATTSPPSWPTTTTTLPSCSSFFSPPVFQAILDGTEISSGNRARATMFGTRGVPNHSILPSPPPQPPQPIVVAYRRRRSHVPDYFLRGIRPLRQLLGNNGNGGLLLSKAPSTGNLEDLQLITTTTTTETQNNSEDEREPLQLGLPKIGGNNPLDLLVRLQSQLGGGGGQPPPPPAAVINNNRKGRHRSLQAGMMVTNTNTLVTDQPQQQQLLASSFSTSAGGNTNATTTSSSNSNSREVQLLEAKLMEVGSRIQDFIGEQIDLWKRGTDTEECIGARVRKVGRAHSKMGIVIQAPAWKEFKTTTLSIIGKCEFISEEDRSETLDAWNWLLSAIIREFRLGLLCEEAAASSSQHQSSHVSTAKNSASCPAAVAKYSVASSFSINTPAFAAVAPPLLGAGGGDGGGYGTPPNAVKASHHCHAPM